jgi:hypothetical protein
VFSYEQLSNSCEAVNVARSPFQLALLYIALIQFIRYVLLTQLNDRKMLFKETNVLKLDWKLRILKDMSKWWFTVLIFLPLLVFFVGIMAMVYISGDCDNILYIQNILVLTIVCVWGALTLGVMLIDFILSLRKCKNCQIIQEDNVFYFRSEVYGFGSFVIFIFVIGEILRVTVPGWNPIMDGFATSAYLYVGWMYQCGFVLTITVLRLQASLFRKKKHDVSKIKTILQDPEACELFKAFAQREFSGENILCWSEIQNFKKQVEPEEKKKVAEGIIVGFLSGKSSELEVNVKEQEIEPIRVKAKSQEFNSELFDKLEENLMNNLRDTFGRFIFSHEFLNLEKKRNFMKEATNV